MYNSRPWLHRAFLGVFLVVLMGISACSILDALTGVPRDGSAGGTATTPGNGGIAGTVGGVLGGIPGIIGIIGTLLGTGAVIYQRSRMKTMAAKISDHKDLAQSILTGVIDGLRAANQLGIQDLVLGKIKDEAIRNEVSDLLGAISGEKKA